MSNFTTNLCKCLSVHSQHFRMPHYEAHDQAAAAMMPIHIAGCQKFLSLDWLESSLPAELSSLRLASHQGVWRVPCASTLWVFARHWPRHGRQSCACECAWNQTVERLHVPSLQLEKTACQRYLGSLRSLVELYVFGELDRCVHASTRLRAVAWSWQPP